MVRRLSSAVFVGRSKELGELRSAADAAVSGGASLVLIAGEAGVGKSRLVTEAAARLQGDGWLVLQGGSVAVGEDGLPFGPLVEALRTLARTVDPDRIAAAAGPSLPELTRLVPELAAVAPDPPDQTGPADWLQVRIFEGVLRLLGRLGETTPVLFVTEDLNWADRSTRDLLAFLARNVREERLLMIGTYRDDELDRQHPLATWLAEAERQPRVERIDLARFGRDELDELLTAIAGAPPAPELVESIAARSDGNAFFAEELAAAVDEAGQRRTAVAGDAPWRPARPPGRSIGTGGAPRPGRRCGRPPGRPRPAGRRLRLARARPRRPRSTKWSTRSSWSSIPTMSSSAIDSGMRSSRKPRMTSCCRRSGAVSMRPTPTPSRAAWRAPGPPPPTGSRSCPITGRQPTSRPVPCAPRSPPATRRG